MMCIDKMNTSFSLRGCFWFLIDLFTLLTLLYTILYTLTQETRYDDGTRTYSRSKNIKWFFKNYGRMPSCYFNSNSVGISIRYHWNTLNDFVSKKPYYNQSRLITCRPTLFLVVITSK